MRYRHTKRMALKQPHWKSNPFVLIVGVAQTRFSRSQLAKLGLWGQTIEAAEATKPFFSKRERIPRRFQIAQASKWPGKAMMANLLRLMAACCRLMARDIICVPSTWAEPDTHVAEPAERQKVYRIFSCNCYAREFTKCLREQDMYALENRQ